MFDDRQLVIITPSNKTISHYRSKGYDAKIGEPIYVYAHDLTSGSHAKVKVTCDICGCYLGEHNEITYLNYITQHNRQGIDCCKKCKSMKTKITNNQKYNGSSPMCSKTVQAKSQQTCMKNYGCEFAMQNISNVQKAQNTNMKKYGSKAPMGNQQIRERAEQTNMQRYGYTYKFISPESLQNARYALKQKGYTRISSQAQSVYEMLCQIYGNEFCKQEVPVLRYSLDCVLYIDDAQIDIEYDGEYWHENNVEFDSKRDKELINLGYKVLRIKSKKKIPDISVLKEKIDYLINSNNNITQIIL